ncbi:MAG: APC family permease [Vulcanimicrobiota bacterium]
MIITRISDTIISMGLSSKTDCSKTNEQALNGSAASGNQLHLFDITMIVIGLVIGMGIFRTATDSAQAALTPSVYFAAWVAGGIIALCGALTYAEIGSRLPVTGGFYKVFAICYHPSIAFAINCVLIISNAASLSGVALIGSEYICRIAFPDSPGDLVKAHIAMMAIIVFYGVNMAGLRISARVQNVLMMIKITMLIALILALFCPKSSAVMAAAASKTGGSLLEYIKSFGMALVAVSFTYGGYQHSINFGEEVTEPRRTLPKGIFIGIAVILTLYFLVQFSYVRIIGFEDLKHTQGIAAVVAERAYGPVGKYSFSILLFIAVLAYVNVQLLSNPRIMCAMSSDGILPASFNWRTKGRNVLAVSLTVFTAICVMVLFFANTFDRILNFVIFIDSIGMIFSASSLFILRKRTKDLDNTGIFTVRPYPLIPLIFIISFVFIGVSISVSTPVLALTGLAVFTLFLIIYFMLVRKKTAYAPDP